VPETGVSISFDHPLCDDAVNLGDSIPVYAGFTTHLLGDYPDDETGGQGIYGVGALAVIDNDLLVEKIEWRVSPLRDGDVQGCKNPVISDQFNQATRGPSGKTELDWVKVNLGDETRKDFSAIIVEYIYDKGGEEFSARAGDRFKIECRVTERGTGIERMCEEPLYFHIVPGPKELHIAVDEAEPGDRDQLVRGHLQGDLAHYEKMPKQEFLGLFQNYRIKTPVGSGKDKRFIVYCFDRFRNPVEAGTGASWRLNAGGHLGEPGPSGTFDSDILPGDSEEEYDTEIGELGKAEILFTQTTYPSCPWSPEVDPDSLGSAVEIIVDSNQSEAGASRLTVEDGPAPSLIKGVKLRFEDTMADWPDGNPFLDKHETRPVKIFAELEFYIGDAAPLKGVIVDFYSTNGSLTDGSAMTDDTGKATTTLTPASAIVGPIEVVAKFSTKSMLAVPWNAAWEVTPGAPYVTFEHEIIAGNIPANKLMQVDTMCEIDENLHPNGGPVGDGMLQVGISKSSQIKIHGQRRHTYTVNARSSGNTLGPNYKKVSYSFESLATAPHQSLGYDFQFHSPSTDGLYNASLGEGSFLSPVSSEALAALAETPSMRVGGNLVASGTKVDGHFFPLGEHLGKTVYVSANHVLALRSIPDPNGPDFLAWSISLRTTVPPGTSDPLFGAADIIAIDPTVPHAATPDLAVNWQPHGSTAGQPSVSVVAAAPAENRTIAPQGAQRLQGSGALLFSDPAAIDFFGAPNTELAFCFAIPEGTPDAPTRVLWTKGPGASLVLERDLAAGTLNLALHFQTQAGGTLQSHVLRGESIDHFPGRWYRAKVNVYADRIVLQTSRSASAYGHAEAQSVVVRDEVGLLAGYTDGSVFPLASGMTIAANVAPVIVPETTGLLLDAFEFTRFDPVVGLGHFIITGLQPHNTIVTDELGIATLTISADGQLPNDHYVPEILDLEFTGSETFKARLYMTTDWFKARLIEVGHAVLTGTDGLGTGAQWHEKAAAWASEALPLAGDLRTLTFEVYKGFTGCDKVNGWAVAFSAGGLVLDVVTLGGAKIVTTPLVVGVKAGKSFLKALPVTLLINAGLESAVTAYTGYINRITQEASKQAAEDPEWATGADAFINFSQSKVQAAANPNSTDEFALNFFGAMGSVNDVFALADMYKEWGEADMVEFMTLAE
jgi:hypothetical protein